MVSYFYPDDLKEALKIRSEQPVIPLAGGTDLMVRYENWSSLPPSFPGNIMGISHLKELKKIRQENDWLSIGSGVTLDCIIASPEVPELLRRGIEEIAAPAVRNLATLAGNIANSSPAADSLPPLFVMEASLCLISVRGERIIPVQDFITGPGRNDLQSDELIKSILIPMAFIRKEKTGQAFYRKVGTRKANALSKLSYCGWALTEDSILKDIRIAAGAVGPVVVRLPEEEDKLKGCRLRELSAKWAVVRGDYEKKITPIDDQRSTANYRKRTAMKLLDHMISELSDW